MNATTEWDWQSSHVLVVEDDPASRDLLTRRLTRDGVRVSAAPDGPPALAIMSGGGIDAVLLAASIPARAGWQRSIGRRTTGCSP